MAWRRKANSATGFCAALFPLVETRFFDEVSGGNKDRKRLIIKSRHTPRHTEGTCAFSSTLPGYRCYTRTCVQCGAPDSLTGVAAGCWLFLFDFLFWLLFGGLFTAADWTVGACLRSLPPAAAEVGGLRGNNMPEKSSMATGLMFVVVFRTIDHIGHQVGCGS